MSGTPTTWTTYSSFASYEAALLAAIEPYENNPLFNAGSKPALASFGYTTVGSTTYPNDPNDPAAAFTIGYGYNIKKLGSAQIEQDLSNAGIWQTLSTAEMTAIESYKTGDADSVNDITDAGFSLTPQQSVALLTATLPKYEARVPLSGYPGIDLSALRVAAVDAAYNGSIWGPGSQLPTST